jgi:hypothetical protein
MKPNTLIGALVLGLSLVGPLAATAQAQTGSPAAQFEGRVGTVESVRTQAVPNSGSTLGTVGGAVVGGVLGNQVGQGRGRTVATVGGAATLGRDDVGQLVPGLAADFVAFDVTGLLHAGAVADPVAALLFCDTGRVAFSVINGRVVVREGELLTLDVGPHVEQHNRLARMLVARV